MISKIKRIIKGFFDGIKKSSQRRKLKRREIKKTAPHVTKPLDSKQKQAAVDYFAPYTKKSVDTLYHAFYTEKTGRFCPEYLPRDLYANYISQYFNDWAASEQMDNKCYYQTYFPNIRQADTFVYKAHGLWFDGSRRPISKLQAEKLVKSEPVYFMKVANASFGGHGVFFCDSEEERDRMWRKANGLDEDAVFQRPIKQHPAISEIYPDSVNTIRVISLLSQDGVKIYSSVLRMGEGGSKTDNVSSGGMSCGITEDGHLKKYAYSGAGDRYEAHPDTQTVFENREIPCMAEIRKLVCENHPILPHFRLISWDFAVDENTQPVLIEVNLDYGGLDCHQLNNGPLFGEDTEKILKEVFGK